APGDSLPARGLLFRVGETAPGLAPPRRGAPPGAAALGSRAQACRGTLRLGTRGFGPDPRRLRRVREPGLHVSARTGKAPVPPPPVPASPRAPCAGLAADAGFLRRGDVLR